MSPQKWTVGERVYYGLGHPAEKRPIFTIQQIAGEYMNLDNWPWPVSVHSVWLEPVDDFGHWVRQTRAQNGPDDAQNG